MSESDVPLISECPSCRTRFRVTMEQLAVANGRVRCGACLAIFDGREAQVRDEEREVGNEPVDVLPEVDPVGEQTSGPDSAKEGTPSPPEDLEEALESIPDKRLHPLGFATANAAALAVLVAGVLVLQYDVYVHDPVLREVYEKFGVEVPRYKALEEIDVADPTVGERLGDPDGLTVRLDLTNAAPRYQRFPTLVVWFRGADGGFLAEAEQRVEPVAYLPSPTHTRRMTPGTTTSVSLALADPGPEAVSYGISLL